MKELKKKKKNLSKDKILKGVRGRGKRMTKKGESGGGGDSIKTLMSSRGKGMKAGHGEGGKK